MKSTAQSHNFLRAAFAGQFVPQDPAHEPAGTASTRTPRRRAPVASTP